MDATSATDHRWRRAQLVAIALASLWPLGASSCAEQPPAPDTRACLLDTDCGADLRCDFNYCVAAGTNTLRLQARVIPPPDTGLLNQQIPLLSFEQGPDLLIRLIEPAILRGVVRPRGDSFTVNVPGELEVHTSGDIAGLDYRFTTRVWDGVDDRGDGFALSLLPGRYYDATFRADDRTLPPLTFALTPDDIAAGRYEVELPAATDYLHVEGRVRKIDYTPVASARVIALNDADEVVAAVTTEPVRGQFALLLPPAVGDIRLKVQSPADGPVFPDFITTPVAPSGVIDITVPPLPSGTEPFEARIRVAALDSSGGLTPLPGLTVTIVGDLAGGTLRRTATTNARGVARIMTLPGAYECLVTTPPNSPWASWHGRLTLAAYAMSTGGPASVVLERRSPLSGVVIDARWIPLADGVIHATRRVERGADDTLAIAPPPYKATITDGRFELLVDPGSYDLRVVPAPQTGAPAEVLGGVRVDAGLDLAIELPEPALAHLTVAGPDGAYLPGATIELYRAPPADDNRTTATPPPLLVKGATGDEGYVDLFIPFAR